MAGSTVIVPKITGYAAFDPTAIAITGGTAKFDDGAVGSPSISFTNNPTTGFYNVGSNYIGVACGGQPSMYLSNTETKLTASLALGWCSGDASTSRDTTLMRGSAGVIKFASANSFSANGSVATVLGSLGPTGSHTAVQKWLTIQDSGGTVGYIPMF